MVHTDYNLKFTKEAYTNAPHVFRNNLWYSDDVSVVDDFAADVRLYPNPVSDNLYLTLPHPGPEISIYDINGRLVYKQVATCIKTAIDMSGFNRGVYLIWIKNGNQEMVKKIIKK